MNDIQGGGRVWGLVQSTALLLPWPVASSHDGSKMGERVGLPPLRNSLSGLCALLFYERTPEDERLLQLHVRKWLGCLRFPHVLQGWASFSTSEYRPMFFF